MEIPYKGLERMAKVSSSPDTCSVIFVADKKDRKRFLEFPYELYAKDPVFVPPLMLLQMDLTDQQKNPFYKNADVAFFIAEFNGQIAGRIAAIHNHVYNDYNQTNVGFFGFFECIENQTVANLLFKVAGDWLRERGAGDIYGPMSPNMMGEMGVLIEGFDMSPNFLMPYNKPYYDALITKAGFQKYVDLLAYRITEQTVRMERALRAEEIILSRLPGLKVRPVDLKNFRKEIVIIREIFNKAWANNWGFTPISVEEFEFLVNDLRFIIDPTLAHVVEVDGQPVAFSISLPDLNQALKKINGRLLPFGFIKLLYHKSKIRDLRTALMGVIPEYHGKGIDAVMHRHTISNGLAKGMKSAEFSWLLETNTGVINVAERFGAVFEKRYRMYKNQ
jgi:GNAT superfamily N-acetyltransferase